MTQFKFLHMISQFQYIFPKLLLKCSNRRAPFPGYRTVFRPDRPNSRNQLWLIPDADVKACKFSQQPTNCARYAKENCFSIAATGECRPSLSAAVSQSEPTVAPVGGANAQSAARGHGTLCCFAQLCLLSSPSRRQKLPQQVFVHLRDVGYHPLWDDEWFCTGEELFFFRLEILGACFCYLVSLLGMVSSMTRFWWKFYQANESCSTSSGWWSVRSILWCVGVSCHTATLGRIIIDDSKHVFLDWKWWQGTFVSTLKGLKCTGCHRYCIGSWHNRSGLLGWSVNYNYLMKPAKLFQFDTLIIDW